jgi:hypothetical protein
MEVPSEAFDCLLHSLRNELATAIGNCDLFVMQATREGSDAARTAVAVREAYERAAGHIEAWREANLTPFPHVVRPEFVEIVVPPILGIGPSRTLQGDLAEAAGTIEPYLAPTTTPSLKQPAAVRQFQPRRTRRKGWRRCPER